MTVAVSQGAGSVYGVQRVCAAFDVARSSFYAWRANDALEGPRAPLEKRGPKARLTDQELLVEIRDDLARSPFKGEGHRKVWARLRVLRGIRVSRKRVLRLMRETRLLSPHRVPKAPPRKHDGTIMTDAPNIMWGTDGARVFTVKDGWVWIFAVVEHWNAECLGWHVCKEGHRFNALQPVSMAIQEAFGTVFRDAARGVALRMDHGTQYLSDHFLNQIRFWGLAASFAFVAEPETNGIAERFNRTLKEQAIYGHVFNDIEEVRVAVRNFVGDYNEHWRVEKLGFLSPREARKAWLDREAA
jgi:transposase InsO family protein